MNVRRYCHHFCFWSLAILITGACAGETTAGAGGGASADAGSSSGEADAAASDAASSSGVSDAVSSSGDLDAVSSSGGSDAVSSSGGSDAVSSSGGPDAVSSSGGQDSGSSSGAVDIGSSSGSSGGSVCTVGMGAPTVDCGAGHFCKLDQSNTCAGKGVCSPKPKICNKIFKPVCGCDGKDYGNPCMAASGGTNVAAAGKCANADPCATKKCGDANPCTVDSCEPKTGKCVYKPLAKGSKCDDADTCTGADQCDGAGLCVGAKIPNCTNPLPAGCCKVDGDCKTGACVGQNPAGTGVCKDPATLLKGQCWSDAQCGGKKCIGAVICPCGAQCIVQDKPGTCDAGQVKTCTVGGSGPVQACAANEYCKLPGGQCSGTGVCELQPLKCNKLLMAVCGCDGKTYSNACMAASAGQNLKSKGACTTGDPCANVKCSDGNACTGDLCDPSTGKCEFPPLPKSQPCEDGDKCTLKDVCDGAGKCVAGAKDPTCGQPPKPGCCYKDADCKSGVCVLGAAGAMGRCKETSTLTKGQCWTTAQCGGNKCLNASVCPCGAQCFAPDKPGTCDNPPPPLPGCCNTSKDCKQTEVCFEGPFKAFKCMSLSGLQKGQCWTNAQCGKGWTCTGAMACGCKALCKAMDKPGTCTPPLNLCANVVCNDNNNCTTDTCDPTTGKCVFTPIPGCGGGGSGCCKVDADCKDGVCVNGALGSGVCKPAKVVAGTCWVDSQCGVGASCGGVIACPCNAKCKVPDKIGTCSNVAGVCIVGKGPCPAGQYCNGAIGQCGKPGACVNFGPQMCNMMFKPVCGCDAKTYSNACVAASKGAAIAKDGACGP